MCIRKTSGNGIWGRSVICLVKLYERKISLSKRGIHHPLRWRHPPSSVGLRRAGEEHGEKSFEMGWQSATRACPGQMAKAIFLRDYNLGRLCNCLEIPHHEHHSLILVRVPCKPYPSFYQTAILWNCRRAQQPWMQRAPLVRDWQRLLWQSLSTMCRWIWDMGLKTETAFRCLPSRIRKDGKYTGIRHLT